MYYYYQCFPSFEGNTVLFRNDNNYVNSSRSYNPIVIMDPIFLHHAYTAKIKITNLLISTVTRNSRNCNLIGHVMTVW